MRDKRQFETDASERGGDGGGHHDGDHSGEDYGDYVDGGVGLAVYEIANAIVQEG